MILTVTWDPDAQDELARIWMASQFPNSVTRASHQIDQILRVSASKAGEAAGTWRRITVDPLEVIYKVVPDDCLVRVLWVKEV